MKNKEILHQNDGHVKLYPVVPSLYFCLLYSIGIQSQQSERFLRRPVKAEANFTKCEMRQVQGFPVVS